MATIKKYNLAGLSANVELGKQGSYITGSANVIGFYANGGALQKLEIANATASTHAVTLAQLDQVRDDLIQHVTLDFDFDNGTSNIATVAAGTRIFSVTVDIPSAWQGTEDNTTTYVEVGDTGSASRYMRQQDVDVLTAGQYHSQFQYEYDTETVLKLSVTQGNATSGSGTVSVIMSSDTVTLNT